MIEQENEFDEEASESVQRHLLLRAISDKVSARCLQALRTECEMWYKTYELVLDEDIAPSQKRTVIALQKDTNILIDGFNERIEILKEEQQ